MTEKKMVGESVIGELIYNCHSSGNSDLTIDLPFETSNLAQGERAYFQINGNSVSFTSIEQRNRFLADYLFDKHREELQSNFHQWLQIAHDIWRREIGSSDRAAGRLLALVHDSKDIWLVS